MQKNKKNRIFVLLLFIGPVDQYLCAIGEAVLNDAYRQPGSDLPIRYYAVERAIRIAGAAYPTLIGTEPAVSRIDATTFNRSLDSSPKASGSLGSYRTEPRINRPARIRQFVHPISKILGPMESMGEPYQIYSRVTSKLPGPATNDRARPLTYRAESSAGLNRRRSRNP